MKDASGHCRKERGCLAAVQNCRKEASRGTSSEELLLAALFQKYIALETFTEVLFCSQSGILKETFFCSSLELVLYVRARGI
ncbi:hypothetical protein POTOM_004585 [Populus tomentosa]|uniref:Uncharacterized protein n=1 Tax=Populus tomentosa TaxID=118781 RepID=A0A8X8AFE3_POPTO|nr:hypothetical protein POTOM_004585 [Populus tomentosa]